MASDSESNSSSCWCNCVIISLLAWAAVALTVAFLSCVTIQPINFVQHNVTVGKVNGTLQFGSLGYCLIVPGKNTTCAFNIFHPINNTKINSQIKGGTVFPVIFPLSSTPAFVAALFTLIFAFIQGTYGKWSALIGAISAGVVCVFSTAFCLANTSGGFSHNMGTGSYLTLTAGVTLLFFYFFPRYFPVEKKKEEKKKKAAAEEAEKKAKEEAQQQKEHEEAEAAALAQYELEHQQWQMFQRERAAAATPVKKEKK